MHHRPHLTTNHLQYYRPPAGPHRMLVRHCHKTTCVWDELLVVNRRMFCSAHKYRILCKKCRRESNPTTLKSLDYNVVMTFRFNNNNNNNDEAAEPHMSFIHNNLCDVQSMLSENLTIHAKNSSTSCTEMKFVQCCLIFV